MANWAEERSAFFKSIPVSRPSTIITIDYKTTGVQETKRTLDNLKKVLNAEGRTRLARKVIDLVISRTLERMIGIEDIPLKFPGGKESKSLNAHFLTQIRDIIRKKRNVSSGVVGFAPRLQLDAIKAGGEHTKSEFRHVWQIMEFGTGIYAAPEPRISGEFKVPGGGGAWFLSRSTKSPVILGQEGGHFLFGLRKHTESVREDINLVLESVYNEVEDILRS